MTEYHASEPSTYQPARDTGTGAGAPHHTVEGARNAAVNGPITFRYPNAFEEVRIGVRMAELAHSTMGVTIDQLPALARLYLRAIASLEHSIVTAPEGWYMTDGNNQPVLAPGQLTNGDEHKVLEAYEGLAQWKATFRGDAPGAEHAEGPSPVVPSDETGGQPPD